MTHREGRHDEPEPAGGAAEEQQADEEEQVVGPDEDVLESSRHERAEHRAHALPGTGVVLHRRMSGVENRLVAQRPALVHVDERLVIRVVGEEGGFDPQTARWACGIDAHRETHALTVGHRRDVTEGDDRRPAVEQKPQPALQHLGQGALMPSRHRRIQQRVGIGQPQLEGRIEIVHRQRAPEARRLEAQVEVAERGGVGGHRAGAHGEQQGQGGHEA